MDRKTSQLSQLRIDRDAAARRRAALRPWWMVGGLIVIALGVGGWIAFPYANAIPVRVAVARAGVAAPAPAGTVVDASGYVVARTQATISAKVAGKVVELSVEEGQHVEKDQIVARLDDTNTRAALQQAEALVAQAEANLAAAKVMLDDATPIFRRSQAVFEKGVISREAYDNAKTSYDRARNGLFAAERGLTVAQAGVLVAQRNQDDTVVRAPFAGVVTARAAQVGEIVSPVSAGAGFTRTGIVTIVDMDSLEAEVDVSEHFIHLVRPGQSATVKLDAYPDWQIPGGTIAIIPTADRSKATVKVRVGFLEKDPRIMPDLVARVSFMGAAPAAAVASEPGVIVPPEAVRTAGDTSIVFVIRGDRVERRVVRLGARTAEGQTILSGMAPGERIAVDGSGRLAEGSTIRVEN